MLNNTVPCFKLQHQRERKSVTNNTQEGIYSPCNGFRYVTSHLPLVQTRGIYFEQYEAKYKDNIPGQEYRSRGTRLN